MSQEVCWINSCEVSKKMLFSIISAQVECSVWRVLFIKKKHNKLTHFFILSLFARSLCLQFYVSLTHTNTAAHRLCQYFLTIWGENISSTGLAFEDPVISFTLVSDFLFESLEDVTFGTWLIMKNIGLNLLLEWEMTFCQLILSGWHSPGTIPASLWFFFHNYLLHSNLKPLDYSRNPFRSGYKKLET